MIGHVRMRKNMVILISSNVGIKTTDGRWLFQKNRWERIMMVVRKPLHPCGPVRTSFTQVFSCRTTIVTTTAAAVVNSFIAAACTTYHTIVCVRLRRCCSSLLRGGGDGCLYPPPPHKKITSDNQCIPETSVGHIRQPEYQLALGTNTDFAGWTYGGKAVSRCMGFPTFIH
jgi:hypothetical protein